MINADNIIHASEIVLIILVSATVISYTSKYIFASEKGTNKKSVNQIYDPDHGRNMSHICILSKEPHSTAYENSQCFNRTHIQWYNPWLCHSLWRRFWKELEMEMKKKKELKVEAPNVTESQSVNETTPPEDILPENGKKETKEVAEKPIEFVYSILAGLLIISVVVAFWEVFTDKLTKNEAAAAKVQERECTLADFTINRHLRRESKQQAASHLQRQASLELTAKVTQNLIHQSSLDRAFPKSVSEVMNSSEVRRNSMPFHLASETEQLTKRSQAVPPSKRFSVDVSGEEMSLDLKKKPRYFIRRH